MSKPVIWSPALFAPFSGSTAHVFGSAALAPRAPAGFEATAEMIIIAAKPKPGPTIRCARSPLSRPLLGR
jgi:hypothetical protein